jgi:hypothetical protein
MGGGGAADTPSPLRGESRHTPRSEMRYRQTRHKDHVGGGADTPPPVRGVQTHPRAWRGRKDNPLWPVRGERVDTPLNPVREREQIHGVTRP